MSKVGGKDDRRERTGKKRWSTLSPPCLQMCLSSRFYLSEGRQMRFCVGECVCVCACAHERRRVRGYCVRVRVFFRGTGFASFHFLQEPSVFSSPGTVLSEEAPETQQLCYGCPVAAIEWLYSHLCYSWGLSYVSSGKLGPEEAFWGNTV